MKLTTSYSGNWVLFCLEKFEGNLGQWLWIVGVLVVVVGSNGVYSASFGFQVFELFWVFNFFWQGHEE